MGCACRGSRPTGKATQYEAIGANGDRHGPFLTQLEAKIKLTEIGGGVVQPITTPA